MQADLDAGWPPDAKRLRWVYRGEDGDLQLWQEQELGGRVEADIGGDAILRSGANAARDGFLNKGL